MGTGFGHLKHSIKTQAEKSTYEAVSNWATPALNTQTINFLWLIAW